MNRSPKHAPGAVDVWMVALDTPGCGGPRDWALLGDDERDRAERFAFPRDRRRFVARRAALRRLLARGTGCAAGAIRYVTGPFGRPRLADAGPEFSLSHRGERALVAIGNVARVGVDIERVDQAHAEPGMLARHVDPGLAASVDAALRGDDLAPFFRWWTIVEAMAKARGTGIAVEPVVRARTNWLDGVELPDDEGRIRSWRLHCWQPEPGMTAAVASAGGSATELHLHGVASSAAVLANESEDAA